MGALFTKYWLYDAVFLIHVGSILVPLIQFGFHFPCILVPKQPKYTQTNLSKGNHKGGAGAESARPTLPSVEAAGGRLPLCSLLCVYVRCLGTRME